MKVMRPLVMALALMSVGPVLVYATTAEAAETAAIGADGLVEILPVPSIVADGTTKVNVHVVALAPNGAPFPGVKLKTDSSTGETSDATEASPGLYTFEYTPAKSTSDVDVTLSVKGKSATRATVEAEYRFTVKGIPTGAIEGTANPTEIVLGKVDEATLTFQGGPAKGDLLVRVSGGEVTNLTNMGGGKHTARFAAPKVNFPQFALVTLASAANPDGNFGYQKVPLHGAVDYPVEASPNSSVMLKIEGKEYGPVKASTEGRANVPVVVPPGIDKATLVTIVDGTSTEKGIDLRVPPTRLLSLFPLPKMVPSDSSLSVPVRTVILNADGSPNTNAALSMTVSSGTISAAKHVKSGIYEARWIPPESDESSTATIEVKVGDGEVQNDSMDVELGPRRAAVIALSTDPAEIDEGVKSAKVNYVVTSASGQPMDSQVLSVNTLGASIDGAPTGGGGGNYSSEVSIDTAGAKMGVLIRSEAGGNSVAHIALVPSADRTLNDGAAGTVVTIASVDTYGYPVANTEVSLSLGSGGGSLPGKVTTDANGITQIQYTSGKDAALVRILASTSSGASGATSFVQAPEKTVPIDLPISGSSEVAGVHRAWELSAPVMSLGAGGGGGGAAVVAAATVGPPPPPAVEVGDPDAEIDSVEVISWPDEVPPGSALLVRAIPRDADGKAIPGKTLDILTSKGEVGETKEDGAVYDTWVEVSDSADTEIKVSVVAGDSMKLVKVPINPDADAVAMGGAPEDDGPKPKWGATDEPEPEPEPAGPEPEPEPEAEPKEPKEPGEIPFLRARVSGIGSLYSYSQIPTEDNGPLLPQQLVVGGASGGRAATPVGAEINARMWVPDIPYLGAVANVRFSRYAIAAAEFNGEAPDWLNDIQVDVVGRYPFDVNGDQYWVGGKAGVHYNDFMIFTGCLDPGCQVNFDPLGLVGLGIGVEAGLEVSGLFAIAGFTEGLASFTVPYSTAVDANVGYQLHTNAFVDLGFTYMNRALILEGTDSGLDRGELSDGQIMGKIGAGFSM